MRRITRGGCKVSKSETSIGWGLREFKEETQGSVITPKPEYLTIFLQGTKGLPWVTLMYDYNFKDYIAFYTQSRNCMVCHR